MNHSKRTFVLAQMAVRHFSRTAPQNAETVTPKFQRLKEVQKKFGAEDNVPVYLKGGLFDKLLYQATVIVTLAGLGLSFQTFYDLTKK
ncbi:hypothetical protein Zmor_001453 [Zophobas morio]|uniref:Uncharacterized protein n=1 Tax=Zophobas morio TaxID=2755281 RepID=A0AA38MRX6_9CUCU|nr:hypothetical protein Zmor_001453 [Zophobas morio]